ncbi:hypothetical protein D5086_013167 [Populus alba]|uniref:Uncharacterized protein n=1 Tax=Populus alba TaxID=43335 RepID=A0ACC4C477_POPAL
MNMNGFESQQRQEPLKKTEMARDYKCPNLSQFPRPTSSLPNFMTKPTKPFLALKMMILCLLTEQRFRRVDQQNQSASESVSDHDLDLTNAVPGHLIAYEDIESDLLLAGDLNWNIVLPITYRVSFFLFFFRSIIIGYACDVNGYATLLLALNLSLWVCEYIETLWRVAKRIRILPAKGNSRKRTGGAA